ncbi:g8854 [Coccomyxa elongata]
MDDALFGMSETPLIGSYKVTGKIGYLHRDLKPANLLLTWEGELKVADMGLARARDVTLERSAGYTHTVATRWYRAPELLLASHSYGPAADMWSVGCILAEMLGAGPLFAGDTDLDQLGRVVAVLGSINVQDWPEVTALPDFGKVPIHHE